LSALYFGFYFCFSIIMDTKVGFIGTGHMARAMSRGLIKTKTIHPETLFGYDVKPEAAQKFAEQTGGTAVTTLKDLVAGSDVVFLSVKPQQMGEVLHNLASLRAHGYNPLWITIAAGIQLKTYLKDLGTSARLVRVMPNTPCLVGEGVCGFCLSDGANKDDAELALDLLSTVGLAIPFPERQLDAVAGLSGSGPAYVYMMIDAMADGGVKMGLPREQSLLLAAQTVLGAAKVVLQTSEHPGALKDKVCSPRGTTINGVHSLERDGFRAAVINAVEVATLRSREMGLEHDETSKQK
jgi:pyrroline-5-carboxylate reductase